MGKSGHEFLYRIPFHIRLDKIKRHKHANHRSRIVFIFDIFCKGFLVSLWGMLCTISKDNLQIDSKYLEKFNYISNLFQSFSLATEKAFC